MEDTQLPNRDWSVRIQREYTTGLNLCILSKVISQFLRENWYNPCPLVYIEKQSRREHEKFSWGCSVWCRVGSRTQAWCSFHDACTRLLRWHAAEAKWTHQYFFQAGAEGRFIALSSHTHRYGCFDYAHVWVAFLQGQWPSGDSKADTCRTIWV